MFSIYYAVVGAILLMPWSILGLIAAGYLRTRWVQRVRLAKPEAAQALPRKTLPGLAGPMGSPHGARAS
jgi:hypothetical protein